MADPTYEVSLLGPAVTFAGSAYVEKTSPTSLPPSSGAPFTIEGWARPTDTTSRSQKRPIAAYGPNIPVNSQGALQPYIGFQPTTLKWRAGTNGPAGGGNFAEGGSVNSGVWKHIAGIYTGSLIQLVVDGVLVGSAAATSTPSVSAVRVGAWIATTDNNTAWIGDLDEVRIWNVARTQQQISDNRFRRLTGTESGLVLYWQFDESSAVALSSGELLYDSSPSSNTGTAIGPGATWTERPIEVTSDCLRVFYTRDVAAVDDGIQIGAARIVLDNFDATYSPENADSKYSGLLKPNKPIRIRATHSGSTYDLWRGVVDEWAVAPPLQQRQAIIRASDAGKTLSLRRVSLPIRTETNAGSLVTDVLSVAGFSTSQRSVDGLDDTIPFAWFQDVSALDALEQVLRFGHYQMYFGEDGAVYFKRRDWGIGDIAGTVVASYVNDFFGLTYALPERRIVNRARVEGTPRKQNTSVNTIAWLDQVLAVVASSSIGFTLDYLDPATKERNTPATSVSVTRSSDYTTNTQAGGGGTDRTANASAQITDQGASVVCSIFNGSGDTVFLTKFQVRGFSIPRVPEVTYATRDTSSENVYGRREFTLASEFIGTQPYAKDYADFIVLDRKEPLPEIGFTLKNVFPDLLARNVGNVVHLVESNTALGSRYAIVGLEGDIALERGLEHSVTYRVKHWRDRELLVLDHATFGKLDNRRLGF